MCDANLHRYSVSVRPKACLSAQSNRKRQDLRYPNNETERIMPGPLDAPLQTFTLFLESETGVLETTMGAFEVAGQSFLRPISCEVSSGQPEQFSRSQLQAALGMYQWALSYPQVLSEGRVVREYSDSPSAVDEAWSEDSDGSDED